MNQVSSPRRNGEEPPMVSGEFEPVWNAGVFLGPQNDVIFEG